jgi:DNA polymerase-3 subunit delta
MYKNVFDNHLLNNKIFSAYFFYGASDFLIEQYALKVSLSLALGDDIFKVYFDDYKYDMCKDYLSQSSLFSNSNILLLKINKKIPKKELDALIEACNLNQNSHLICTALGDTDFKIMSKSFSLKQNSADVRFFLPDATQSINILKKEASKLNIVFSSSALTHLYEMHEKDLSLCISDIKKLSILDEEITTKTITNMCFGLGSVSIDDFMIKLFSYQSFDSDLHKLLEEGMNEILLVNQITSFAQQLFSINSYLKIYGELNIIDIWGYNLPKNIANQRALVASRFKQEQFLLILNFLLNLELELKNSITIDKNIYLQASLRKLSAIIR